VYWTSTRQRKISWEAEYYRVVEETSYLLFLQDVVTKLNSVLGIPSQEGSPVFCDNHSSAHIAKDLIPFPGKSISRWQILGFKKKGQRIFPRKNNLLISSQRLSVVEDPYT